jgi:uncharacterized protein (TIRG00374 family)
MRVGWRGAFGIALSVLLLWITLRDVNLREVAAILFESNPWLWLLSAATATAIFPLRARRWQAILAPAAGRLPFAPLWRSTAIGMMVNNVLPVRAGEVARAFALSRAVPQVKFATAFASLAVDRIFDGVVVIALFLVASLDSRFPADAQILGGSVDALALSAGLFLGAVLAALYAMTLAPERFTAFAEWAVGLVWRAGALKVRALLTSFVSGLGVLHRPRLALEVLWWTLLHWVVNAAAFWLGFVALGLDAPFSAAFFVQMLVVVAVALPSSPGFFGPFELAGKTALALYAVSDAAAVSWAIGFHLLSFVPITVIGVWYFTRMDLHVKDFAAAAPES